jgi:hypothetical protein
MGNPAFKGKKGYTPQKVYKNVNGMNREYGEMWTADWWCNLQVVVKSHSLREIYSCHIFHQKKLPDGITLAFL